MTTRFGATARASAVALACASLVAGCALGGPHPSSVDDVRRAFAAEGVPLVEERVDGLESWGTRLVPADGSRALDVVVFVDPGGASAVEGALAGFADAGIDMPRLEDADAGSPETGRVERRGNVLVLVPAATTDAVERRAVRALRRLPAG